jgi:hypothetical protein
MIKKPTPYSAWPLPGWACRLAVRATQGRLTSLDKLWTYPGLILKQTGITPDPWQSEVLRSQKAQILLLCSRQVGKMLVAAALALRTPLLEAPALVLVLTPSERQLGSWAVEDALADAFDDRACGRDRVLRVRLSLPDWGLSECPAAKSRP